jgi:anaerobic selenocysteine-containing dehydrogenase
MNGEDAQARQIEDKATVQVSSRVGAVTVEVQLSDDMMVGVVSLPHGWGHHGAGVELDIASENPGVSINQLTDEEFLDPLTGNAGFSGVSVQVGLE